MEEQEIEQESTSTEQADMPVEHVKEKKVRSEKLSIKIIERKENPILDREEIIAVAHAPKTPSKEQVKHALVSELKASEENVVLKNVLTSFGVNEVKIFAYLYKNKETMQKLAIKKKSKEEGEKVEQ